MQIRAQRSLAEAVLPIARDELIDVLRRMAIDALQHIDQIVIGIDTMQLAGADCGQLGGDDGREQQGNRQHLLG